MATVGTCSYCGSPARQTCKMCGKAICPTHAAKQGAEVCKACASGAEF